MDPRTHGFLALIFLIISSILCLQSKADRTGSVFFLDSSTYRYFQPRSSEGYGSTINCHEYFNHADLVIAPEFIRGAVSSETASLLLGVDKPQSLLLPEIGAAISLLLGFAPLTLSPASSKKLDEVLMPNPFDRPRAIFVLEINGVEDNGVELGIDSDVFNGSLKSRVVLGDNYADIRLSDEEEVSLVSLNEPLPSDTECIDNILTDFASWLGGSYVRSPVESLNGELTIPLANDIQLKFHMSKDADREYTMSLVSLIQNVKRAVQMHQAFLGSMHGPTELVMGRFDGMKALQEEYGSSDLVHQGVELLVISLSKIYNLLQTVYKGKIVGVVLFKESGTMLSVKLAGGDWQWQGSPNEMMIVQVVLVQRTLAWITGSIFLIAALLGIYSLMNTILSRDTLLYSYVKVD